MIPRYTQQISVFTFFLALFVRKKEFQRNFLFFNSCRGTIKWLLSHQRLYHNRKLKIGMPCYVCDTVYQAVSESDNTIILLDINPLGFSFTSELNEQIKNLDVLIWVNYFGFKYNSILKQIRSGFPDLIIVEDCSQVDLRDYLSKNSKDCYSDYSVFSFNFRKPITAGGGGLLIPNAERNTEFTQYLFKTYYQLSFERLTLHKIIHILIYNFSYNQVIFMIFNKLISNKRNQSFKPEELPIRSLYMNRILQGIFYIQYMNEKQKKESEGYTLNYFYRLPDLVENISFGSLSYYPVTLKRFEDYSLNNNIDKYMLWENLEESYRFFNIDISQDKFPLTFKFLSEIIFLPAKFFKNPDNRDIGFPEYHNND